LSVARCVLKRHTLTSRRPGQNVSNLSQRDRRTLADVLRNTLISKRVVAQPRRVPDNVGENTVIRADRATPSVVVVKGVCWLGGRDSNPDTVVQSHVSYRWTTSQYRLRRARRCEPPSIANPKLDRQAPPPVRVRLS